MPISRLLVSLCLGCWLILQASLESATAKAMVLPIRLDYPLLRAFFVQQAFTEPGETAVVIDEFDGCHYLKLQHPEIYSENGALHLKAQITLSMGLPVLESCQLPLELAGVIDVRLNLQLDAAGWTLHFQTEDLRFTTQDGRSAVLPAEVLDLVKERLFGHLDQVTANISTPVNELRTLVPQFFQAEAQSRIAHWLQAVRPGRMVVGPDAVTVELIMEVETDQQATLPAARERYLSDLEMKQFIRSWEVWDAFLVYQIDRLSQFGLDEPDRNLVLQTLLETRYQLAAALVENQADPGGDLVRRQFVTAWERFSPLFRKYLARDPSVAPLSSLVYLSAGDALAALDQLGPTLGLEISRDGLIRLARLLAVGGSPVNLDYSYEVDPTLRKILGFGPPLPVPEQTYPDDEVDLAQPAAPPRSSLWLWLTPRPALAAVRPPVNLQALKRWRVEESNFDTYLEMVRALLREESRRIVTTDKAVANRGELLAKILPATAWQESCFRQFTVTKEKMTYLRSWNNTSVGLMQINERVWRGLYRVDALRWDPKYNIQAGSEILRMYLATYALKQGGRLTDDEGLARATYALYNSGPQNFKGFLARHAKRNYSKSDTLFGEKYAWTRAGEFGRVKACLFGE